MASYRMQKIVRSRYDDVLQSLPELLKAEGFGILTQIDVKETMKQKLGVDFRRYKILGACNPSFAHRSLSAEIDLGVFMPCNVVVYERDDGQTVVNAVDPSLMATATGNPKLEDIARQVREKLARVLERLQ
jgi:uncharacterized protein (DUF302 family)